MRWSPKVPQTQAMLQKHARASATYSPILKISPDINPPDINFQI
jgi:hypothetical protein